jgi:hypothetical protein
MSVLARYRKKGGFKQLLQLIETSQPAKQEQLLKVVEKEDPQWAALILEKKITPDMILGWEADQLTLIFEHMVPRHCACLFKSNQELNIDEYARLFRGDKYRDLKALIEDSSEPNNGEVVTAYNHLIETVRHLDEEKIINLRFIDPSLGLDEVA